MTGLCVVVGATGALGSAICRRLAPAHPVLAVARREGALAELRERLPGVRTVAADAAEDAFVDTVSAAVRAASTGVRLAVFAAGLGVGGSLDVVPPQALAAAVNTKVGGTIRLLRAVRDSFEQPATFVSVAGSLGFEPGPLDAAPGTANAALANVMRQLSQLYGPRGVTVHTIAPGPLDTPRLHAFAERRAAELGISADAVWAEFVAAASSGRLPTVDDVAWLVEILLSPHAAALHGAVLTPDGGVRRAIG